MKIIVLGATGGTGIEIVRRAVNLGTKWRIRSVAKWLLLGESPGVNLDKMLEH